jgi:hypothetical protein
MSDFLKDQRRSAKYTQVRAVSNLPESHFLYEAQVDLSCAQCGATINVNSYFARKMVKGAPLPHCRECRPFTMYTSSRKTGAVPRSEEYLYVEDSEAPS